MICVSSFWALKDALDKYKPSYLVSLMDNIEAVPTPADIDASNHLRFGFHDVEIETPGKISPTKDDVSRLIKAALRWNEHGGPILVHCTAGVSRSPAAGLILATARQPYKVAKLAQQLTERAPYSRPNNLMIKLADQALSQEGKLISAVAAMGEPGDDTRPRPFVLNT